jgi:hypothetical protein
MWVHVDKVPDGVSRYRVENFDGHISEIMGDGRDINFYVDGNLYAGPGGAIDQKDYDAKATMDLWTERFGNRNAELVNDESIYDTTRKNLARTVTDLPKASVNRSASRHFPISRASIQKSWIMPRGSTRKLPRLPPKHRQRLASRST